MYAFILSCFPELLLAPKRGIIMYVQVKKKAFKINANIEDVGLNED